MIPDLGANVWWAGTHVYLGIHSYKCHKMTPGLGAIVWWAGTHAQLGIHRYKCHKMTLGNGVFCGGMAHTIS